MTPIKVNFRNLQILERGDYDSGYKEGYKIGYETGYSVGFSDGAQNATEEYNQTLLTLTGTTQPTAEEAITEINATLADALTGKGVEAEATETTEELVGKVEQIENWVMTQTKFLGFSDVGLYDETALKYFPNLTLSRCTSINHLFYKNFAVIEIGDVVAPIATSAQYLFGESNVRHIGKVILPEVTVAHRFFAYCRHLESIEELRTPKATSMNELFTSCGSLKRIGLWEIDGRALESASIQHAFTVYPPTGLTCLILADTVNITKSVGIFSGLRGLDEPSVNSIINALADLTGQDTQNLDLHADVIARLTDEQILLAAAKNWNIT